ncbi:MAG: hypothetical protein JNK56_24655 [Myxococcales bacterium]|nr:hypothetical protein [Myxococcales bacterium]
MAQASPAITPALRRLADQAADRALAALHAAADPHHPATTPLALRLAPHLAPLLTRLPATQRTRLRAPARRPAPAPLAPQRPQLRGPHPLPTTPATTPRALDLRLLSLRCDDDTREAGKDEMSLGLVRIVLDHGDPVTQATEVQGPYSLGQFRKGDLRSFSPNRTLTTVLSASAPRTVTSVLVLADIDLGGLDGLLAALASGVTDELILDIAQGLIVTEGAIVGATFLGTLGSIFGPVGTAGGIALGVALGAAVGYAVGKAVAGLVHLFKDDPLDPREWTIGVPAHPAPGLLAAQTLAFSGHGAAYTASLEWHVR